jgi:hypothetical protein
MFANSVFLVCLKTLRTLYSEPPIGTSYKFQIIWPNGFREDFFILANHKQERSPIHHSDGNQGPVLGPTKMSWLHNQEIKILLNVK